LNTVLAGIGGLSEQITFGLTGGKFVAEPTIGLPRPIIFGGGQAPLQACSQAFTKLKWAPPTQGILVEVRCYSEGSNKGSNLTSSARLVADIAVEPSKDPHALYISKVEREQVFEAIQQLPVEFREIILREYEELSYQEIAVVLGCAAGTVMSRLGRARSKLGVLLSDTSQTRDRREKESCE
jgi:RNA polymerase sigma factor (sigma-70 family)